ncbi:unnamed protein product [Didymodactylos carnosus]|uniref:Non-reducing end alpha-L-arabinofuranosidase n=1 Tax=Didymodactylos carnosus TaxID=1234261 RepID=A0A815EQD8_9BILA|nr:unnamed protein product [Didymodactylos carnosus]CAF4161383.1 unnamed protein product [Didymodactylos carnosus]
MFIFEQIYMNMPANCNYVKQISGNVINHATIVSQNYTNVNNFYNLIAQEGADPWVYKHSNGYYYYLKSTGSNLLLSKSRTLTGIDVGKNKTVWSSRDTGPSCRDIWAPELHFLRQKWYIYYAGTTCDSDNVNHRMFVLENKNFDPFIGEFDEKGQITDSTQKWAIDGTVLEHPLSDELYFIWSGWEGDIDVRQLLYIAHMSNPWTIDSERVEIAIPTYSWETNHRPNVNEGAQILIHNSTINLIYSASGSWTNDYSLGLITLDVNNDPMMPSSWIKRSFPLLQSANGLYGPGHASFTKSPDDKENWIVFHNARYNGSGWVRQVRTQIFSWNLDNTPNFCSLNDPNIPIQLPSGEPIRQRYEAEYAEFDSGPSVRYDLAASNHLKVEGLNKTNSLIEFFIYLNMEGWYVVNVRARTSNDENSKTSSSLYLRVNGKESGELTVLYSDNWSIVTTKLFLHDGINALAFTKGLNYVELDFIDIFAN